MLCFCEGIMEKRPDYSIYWVVWGISGAVRLYAVNEFWYSVAGIKSNIVAGILSVAGFIPGLGDLLVFIGAGWGWGWEWYKALIFGFATIVVPSVILILHAGSDKS